LIFNDIIYKYKRYQIILNICIWNNPKNTHVMYCMYFASTSQGITTIILISFKKMFPPHIFVPFNPPEWRPLYTSKDGLFAHKRLSHIIFVQNHCRHNVLNYTHSYIMVIVRLRSPHANNINTLYIILCTMYTRVPILLHLYLHILPVFIFPFKLAISRTYV